ncbi:MAG: 4-hydroxythreonine-4-phosphate dehydrogenase PdxA [Woeseiaceae bacterium]
MIVIKPLAVTAGEPAGIGPDLCVELAVASPGLPFVVFSDAALLRARALQLGKKIDVTVVDARSATSRAAGKNELLVIDTPFPNTPECGRLDPANAATLLEGLTLAVEGCLDNRYSGMVTAPLQKSVINDAGIPFTGHTEFLAALTGTPRPVMMLVAGDLRVALASTHLPLREVPDYLTAEGIHEVLEILYRDLQTRFAIASPEIVVCGLNPHAGEGGHLGSEDAEIIAPVIADFRARGLNVRGPLPADTAFTPAAGHKDAVLAMYHDQGLPVLKYAGFGDAVNITLGLPIVRTSVDHGTALDIAGSGKADAGSMRAALQLAADLARSR